MFQTARVSCGLLTSTLKRRSKQDNLGDGKGRPKKIRTTAASSTPNGNTDLLTNLGLTLNHSHSSPLRKNNSLLDRPEVSQPVNVFLFISYCH